VNRLNKEILQVNQEKRDAEKEMQQVKQEKADMEVSCQHAPILFSNGFN
jgi:hypothetical protein